MKRVLGILVGASLVLAIGCAQPYDLRLKGTLESMKYRRDLEKNTEEPPSKTNLVNHKIFIRAPKGLKGPTDAFAFNIEQGKFDDAYTFLDAEKQASLHILARVNTPKGAAPPKKGPNPSDATDQAAPTAVRGDFTTDVLDLIKSAYSTDVESSQFKPTEIPAQGTPKTVSYKSHSFEVPSKEVKVYFYGSKTDPAQIALIFEGPKESLTKISSQINYSLNSLAVGTRATMLYNGGDEFATDEGAAPPPGGVF
jgi:hypothetical protein